MMNRKLTARNQAMWALRKRCGWTIDKIALAFDCEPRQVWRAHRLHAIQPWRVAPEDGLEIVRYMRAGASNQYIARRTGQSLYVIEQFRTALTAA